MPILKAEQPGLRLTQYKQILQKRWKKSPENPMVSAKYVLLRYVLPLTSGDSSHTEPTSNFIRHYTARRARTHCKAKGRNSGAHACQINYTAAVLANITGQKFLLGSAVLRRGLVLSGCSRGGISLPGCPMPASFPAAAQLTLVTCHVHKKPSTPPSSITVAKTYGIVPSCVSRFFSSTARPTIS